MPRPQTMIDLAAMAESIVTAGTMSLLPQFPRSVADGEAFAFYRNACTRPMRLWIRFALSDLVEVPREELDVRILLEEFATKEIGRTLNAHETRLIGECARDVLTALAITKELNTLDAREQIARDIWAVNGGFQVFGLFKEEVFRQFNNESHPFKLDDYDVLMDAIQNVWRAERAKVDAENREASRRLASPRRLFAS